MHNSKLLQHLTLLTPSELKRLLPFLKSPFYNANPQMVKLYLLLRKAYPDFTSPKLTHERVFKKLFPKRAYDHQKLLNLMSDFVALLKKYLQRLQLEKETQQQEQLLLRAYAERPLGYKFFQKQFSVTEKQLEKVSFRNSEYYRQKFQLYELYFNHPATDKFQLNRTQYEEAMQCLDRSFLLDKLLLGCELKAREKPLAESYEIWLLPEIRQGITRYPIESPIAKTYVEILDLLEREEADTYFRLKSLFWENIHQFTQRQQQNILQSLINFTIRQGNQGDMKFVKENLQLYQFGLSKQLFMKYGILNDMTYLGIVNIALRSGESDWCDQFIEAYSPFLESRSRQDAQSLARALWLYANQEPKAVMNLLQSVSFLNVYYQIQARALLLKVYFETFRKDDSYGDLLVYHSEAFEQFLRRESTISTSQKEALINFTIKVRKLAKLMQALPQNNTQKTRFFQEIEDLPHLYNRDWLLRQQES